VREIKARDHHWAKTLAQQSREKKRASGTSRTIVLLQASLRDKHAEQSLEQQLAAEPAITRTEALSAV